MEESAAWCGATGIVVGRSAGALMHEGRQGNRGRHDCGSSLPRVILGKRITGNDFDDSGRPKC